MMRLLRRAAVETARMDEHQADEALGDRVPSQQRRAVEGDAGPAVETARENAARW